MEGWVRPAQLGPNLDPIGLLTRPWFYISGPSNTLVAMGTPSDRPPPNDNERAMARLILSTTGRIYHGAKLNSCGLVGSALHLFLIMKNCVDELANLPQVTLSPQTADGRQPPVVRWWDQPFLSCF